MKICRTRNVGEAMTFTKEAEGGQQFRSLRVDINSDGTVFLSMNQTLDAPPWKANDMVEISRGLAEVAERATQLVEEEA